MRDIVHRVGAQRALVVVMGTSAAAIASSAVTSSAYAGFVATFQGYGAGQFASCGYRASDAWNSTSSLGMSSLRTYQHVMLGSSDDVRLTWCAQIYQGVTAGTTYDFAEVALESVPGEQPGPMGALRGGVIRDLFARWVDPETKLVIGDAADRDAKSAAFQLAIWEIVHENFTATDAAGIVAQMSLAQGAFRSSPGSSASGWYEVIRSSLGAGGFMQTSVAGLSHPTAQDQIYGPRIPAPGAFALLVL
ncbi:MAG: hypothetical protein ACKO3W_12390, partial [bacterium]